MYDFVFHTNGNVYGADNGLGVAGTVPETHQPDCRGLVTGAQLDTHDPGEQSDRLQLLVEGNFNGEPWRYYGHPNPARDECVFFDGEFQSDVHNTTVNPLPNFVAAHQVLNSAIAGGAGPRSLNSIIEYRGSTSSQIADEDLLITAFAGSAKGLFRIDPVDDGCSPTQFAWNAGCLTQVGGDDFDLGAPLGLTQISNGRIVVGEWITRTDPSSFLVVLTPTG
jgi:hypothetical protein